MGIRTKSKPQSYIHFNLSSVVAGLDVEGLGEKKSRRLNPRQRGNLFLEGDAYTEEVVSRNPEASIPDCFIKERRFIIARLVLPQVKKTNQDQTKKCCQC